MDSLRNRKRKEAQKKTDAASTYSLPSSSLKMENPTNPDVEEPLLPTIELSFWERLFDAIAIFITTYLPFLAKFFGNSIRCPRIGPSLRNELDLLARYSKEPFDPSKRPEHLSSLRLLWEVSFPSLRWPEGLGYKSEQWKEMGWQGIDPSTDTRGAGALAIQQLLYMAREHADLYDTLLNKKIGTRVEWEYPFAASGVNLTFMLLELAGFGGPGVKPSDVWQPPRTPSGAGFVHLLKSEMMGAGLDPRGGPNASVAGPASSSVLTSRESALALDLLGEIYCIAYRRLDQVWLEQKASYMQFPKILQEVKGEMAKALASCPKTLQAVRNSVMGDQGGDE